MYGSRIFHAGVSTGQKIPAKHKHNNNNLIKLFSSFNHGSIVSVGMKNKAFLYFFAPDIFRSIR